jgi:hypothetical protein
MRPTPIATTVSITLSRYPYWGPLTTTGNIRMDPSWALPTKDDYSRITGQGHLKYVQLVGQEPGSIAIPFSKEQQNWLWQFSEMWQNTLANFPGQ